MTDAQFGERVARMETELQYLKRDVDEIKADVGDIKTKQDKIIEMMTEANGMRKLIRWMYGSSAVVGGFVIAYWSTVKGFLTKISG